MSKRMDECDTATEKWIYIFKNLEELEMIPFKDQLKGLEEFETRAKYSVMTFLNFSSVKQLNEYKIKRRAVPFGLPSLIMYGFGRLFNENLLSFVDVDAGTCGLCHTNAVD